MKPVKKRFSQKIGGIKRSTFNLVIVLLKKQLNIRQKQRKN